MSALEITTGELTANQILQQGHRGFLDLEAQLRSLERTGRTERPQTAGIAHIYEEHHTNYPISEMGNYMICLGRQHKLRNPYLSDTENLQETEAYFGNPYKRVAEKAVVDETAMESEVNLHSAPQKMVDIELEPKPASKQNSVPQPPPPPKAAAVAAEKEEKKTAPAPVPVSIPTPEQKEIVVRDSTSNETDQSVVAEFYKECYVFAGEGATLKVFKDVREIAEGVKYAAFTSSLRERILLLFAYPGGRLGKSVDDDQEPPVQWRHRVGHIRPTRGRGREVRGPAVPGGEEKVRGED